MSRVCPFGKCDGGGFVFDEDTRQALRCDCYERLVAERRARRLSAVVPRKYEGVSFDRAPVTAIDERTVRVVRRYVASIGENLDAGTGLWLYGSPGTGKTTLAMLASKAALAAGRSVAIYSLPRLLAEIRTTFEADSEASYTQFIDRLAAVDLLHLDDLGAEKTSDWVLEQLYAIVNARYEEQRALVVTTNLNVAELRDQLGARTVSRISEMCLEISLYGEDRRPPREDVA